MLENKLAEYHRLWNKMSACGRPFHQPRSPRAVIGSRGPAAFQGSGHPSLHSVVAQHPPTSTHLNKPPATPLPANTSITVPHFHIAFHRLYPAKINATVDAKLSVPILRVFERVCGRTRRREGAERPPGQTPSALASHRRICLQHVTCHNNSTS